MTVVSSGGMHCTVSDSCPFATWSEGPVHFLVGQLLGTGVAPHFCVLESYECEDLEVVEEQLQCLESILPAGVSVLGFGYAGTQEQKAIQSLLTSLASNASAPQLSHIVVSKRGDKLTARLGSDAQSHVPVEVVHLDVCWGVRCTAKVHECDSPFVLTCGVAGGKRASVPLDCDSTKLIGAQLTGADLRTCEIVQLGASADNTVAACSHFPLTVCLPYLSGQSVLASVRAYRKQPEFRGHGAVVVPVRSQRPSSIVYAVRVPARDDSPSQLASAGGLTPQEWSRIQNTIEDATGERVDAGSLVGPEVNQQKGTTATSRDAHDHLAERGSSSVAANKPYPPTTLALLLAAVALVCAVLFAFATSLS